MLFSVATFLCVPFPVLIVFLLYSLVFSIHNISDASFLSFPCPLVDYSTVHSQVFAISNVSFCVCRFYLATPLGLCV